MKQKKGKKFDPAIMAELLINPDVAEMFINDDPETQKKRIANFTSDLVKHGAYDAYKETRENAIKKNIEERKQHEKEEKSKTGRSGSGNFIRTFISAWGKRKR